MKKFDENSIGQADQVKEHVEQIKEFKRKHFGEQ
jgi:hypothetical protein